MIQNMTQGRSKTSTGKSHGTWLIWLAHSALTSTAGCTAGSVVVSEIILGMGAACVPRAIISMVNERTWKRNFIVMTKAHPATIQPAMVAQDQAENQSHSESKSTVVIWLKR